MSVLGTQALLSLLRTNKADVKAWKAQLVAQVVGFKQWQADFNRTVNRGVKAIWIVAPIIKN